MAKNKSEFNCVKLFIESVVDSILDTMKHKKRLYIFDFDDTLVRDSANIYLIKKDGTHVVITPADYHNIHLQDEEKINVEEFDEVTNPHVFEDMMNLLKQHEKNAVILTARSNGESVERYLKSLGIHVPVKAVGVMSPTKHAIKINARKKKNWIKNAITTLDLEYVEFWDDNPSNIAQFETLKHEFPRITLISHLVNHKL